MTKEIQEQRMRDYFIQATKEILRGEGLKSISVRNIASRAGYSYATLYNYFKDVKELIFYCVEDFQDECRSAVNASGENSKPGKEKIKLMTQAYVDHFIQYPGIFELFHLEKIPTAGGNKNITDLIWTSFDTLLEDSISEYVEIDKPDPQKARLILGQLKYTVTGMLLFYLQHYRPEDYVTFKKNVSEHIDIILV